MVKLNDLMKDFDIDQSAQVLDIANAVDVVREKMCAKIDRHIKRYIRGEVEYIENKSKKVVKKKVDCLHKATSQANMKAIFLKYGDTHIKIDGQEYINISDKQEEALWEMLKEAIKKGDFDSELTEASRKSSEKLRSSRPKKAKK